MLLKLKGRIIERYRSQWRFAAACGKDASWISQIIQGNKLPTPEEKEKFRIKLQIPEGEIDSYFVPSSEDPAGTQAA